MVYNKRKNIRRHFMAKYVCNVCGYVYDEEEQGVAFADLPDDYACPLCGVGKEDFSPEE